MSQPVKLSDQLVLDARLVSELSERSIAGQIEFWARLGKAVEILLTGDKLLALKQSGDRGRLSTLIASVDAKEGQRRVSDYLLKRPYPHYEKCPDHPGLLVRIDESGTRTIGKFVNRKFQPATKAARTGSGGPLREVARSSKKGKRSK